MEHLICWLIGHRVLVGGWQRYGKKVWFRDITCARCDELLTRQLTRTQSQPLDIH